MERVPFDIKEIENATEVPGFFPGMPPIKVFDRPISPKENFRLLYERKIPFWLPSFNDSQMMTPRVDPDNVARAFAFEANPLSFEEMVGGPDKFGIPWVYVPQAQGSMVEPGNPTMTDTNDWQDIINFPDVANWDWAGSAEANKDWVKTDKWFVYCHLTGLFERMISFMDFDNAAVALIDPDQVDATHALLSALADNAIDIIGRAYNAYGGVFDAINFHDDWGSQRAPFFSKDVCMEMIVPALKKVVSFVHDDLGLFFDMHSCGKNEMLVPCYIEAGCDSWSGQDMNNKPMLYDLYGDKIILGIEPDIPYDMFSPVPMTLEDACASAQRFLDKYVPNFLEKPVTMGFFGGPAGYDEFFYEAARKAFNNLAG
ncbi:MAG: hypothetical protein LBG68_02440 [Coriobacteriales bacterium]|jgi:drug/metabolite transporter superfamily protein YnfA|nr:hypothetical protein [Coriobacteriales bacterium]